MTQDPNHPNNPLNPNNPDLKPPDPPPAGGGEVYSVTNPDGTPVADSGSGKGVMTREKWRTRDKGLGLIHVDAHGKPLPDQA
jgi:hypothetical protein